MQTNNLIFLMLSHCYLKVYTLVVYFSYDPRRSPYRIEICLYFKIQCEYVCTQGNHFNQLCSFHRIGRITNTRTQCTEHIDDRRFCKTSIKTWNIKCTRMCARAFIYTN